MAPHPPPQPEWRINWDKQMRDLISGQEHLHSVRSRTSFYMIAESIRKADHDRLQFAFALTRVPNAALHLETWQGLAKYASRLLGFDFESFTDVEKIVRDACIALNTQAVDKAANHPELRRMGGIARAYTDGLSAVECCMRINDAVKASALARRFYEELMDQIKDAKEILETGYKGERPDPDLEDLKQEEEDAVDEDEEGTEVEGNDDGEDVKQ